MQISIKEQNKTMKKKKKKKVCGGTLGTGSFISSFTINYVNNVNTEQSLSGIYSASQ